MKEPINHPAFPVHPYEGDEINHQSGAIPA